MKAFFSKRRIVQGLFCLFCCWIGIRFAQYVAFISGNSLSFVPKPPSVEGFLPISALLAAKRLLLSGAWDPVHPAGLVLFCFVIVSAFLLRRSFCSTVCPIGFLEEVLFGLGLRLGLVHPLPRWIERILCLPKYLLLAFFASLLVTMDGAAIEAFLFSPYNLVCDTKMLLFFQHPGSNVLLCLCLLALGSLFFPSLWCRSFCPYGALQGLIALLSPVAIQRSPVRCVDCKACEELCPQRIAITRLTRVNVPECTGCLECVRVCKVSSLSLTALGVRIPHPQTWHLAASLLFLFLCYAWARATNHWESTIPLMMLQELHKHIGSIGHF
ncbi:MAG: 4Fe-4S binding protein [Desulfovibrio sp.]|nr:4Fe-4S binding protein [Desulfovibrio sp.]